MSYNRAADILVAALDLPPAERRAFLDLACGPDAALRADVESLIRCAGEAGEKGEAGAEGVRPLFHSFSTDGVRPVDVGANIGPYRVEGMLGAGGMGVVYLARDTRLGRTVALKAIAPQFTDDERWRARLRREARAAAALAHPGVATVYALEDIDGRLYLAAEHCDGETLRAVIDRGPMPTADVIDVGRQIADALAAAHDRRVIHRDLKPENVMRLRDGTIRILDFGLARVDQPADAADAGRPAAPATAAHFTVAGTVFGTPAYMAPEQLRGDAAGAAADIFATGLILAELATGRHPFDAPSKTGVMARALSADPDLTGAAPQLQPILRTCLEKNPGQRYHSAHELRAAFDALAAGRAPHAATGRPAFWWWQFHQAAASLFELALAASLWLLHGSMYAPVTAGLAPILAIVATLAALIAITLRLHRLFAVRIYPTATSASAAARNPLTTAADVVLAAASVAGGAMATASHPVAAILLIASGAVLLVVTTVVEPATATAARL